VQESQVFGAWGAGPFDRFDPRLCCLGWQLQLNKWRVRRQKGFRPSLNPNWMCRSSHVSKNWTSPKENQSAVQSGTISELCMRGRRYLLDSASAATQSSNIPPMVYAGNNFPSKHMAIKNLSFLPTLQFWHCAANYVGSS